MTASQFEPTEVPGYYCAEFGGIAIQVDTVHRVVEMWVTVAMCEDGDYDQAEAVLSSLGIAAFLRGLRGRADADGVQGLHLITSRQE